MSDKKLKYRINDLLNSLSIKEYRKAIKVIPAMLGITKKTFNNYRSIKIGDTQDIPHEKVMMLEQLFNVERGELENFITEVPALCDLEEMEISH